MQTLWLDVEWRRRPAGPPWRFTRFTARRDALVFQTGNAHRGIPRGRTADAAPALVQPAREPPKQNRMEPYHRHCVTSAGLLHRQGDLDIAGILPNDWNLTFSRLNFCARSGMRARGSQ